jgi:quinol monooxygenase YgiN
MVVNWVVPLGESQSITDALHRIMVAARAKQGCLGCSVSTDVGSQVGLRYVEEWADEDLLRRELRSDRFCTLAALMEHATEPPKVEFTLAGGTRGLDYAEEVRAAAAS